MMAASFCEGLFKGAVKYGLALFFYMGDLWIPPYYLAY